MKHAISYLLQNAGQRLAFCLLAVTMCAIPALAQDDDEEVETTIKQPKRTEKVVQYETITIKGTVTDLATKKPLAGVQLQALGYIRYTAMTGEDGTFSIKGPTFATALYVHSPQ